MDCIKKIDSLKIQFLDMLASLNSTQEAVASLPLNNTKFSPSSTLINKIKNHSLKKTIRGRNKTSEKSTPPSKRLLVENYILKCHPHNTDEQTELKKPEKVVLKDVLLVLNNIEGDHIKITEDGEIEFLDEQNGFLASLPPSLIDIALSCCRTGVFARLILGFLKENDGKESSIVWQRFCSVSREYVLDYLAFLRFSSLLTVFFYNFCLYLWPL